MTSPGDLLLLGDECHPSAERAGETAAEAGAADAEALPLLIERLQTAIEARDHFIAVVAHELRNPMTAIRGRVELLQSAAAKEGASPAIAAELQRLSVAVERYIRRATSLLETTRIVSGHLRLQRAPADLSAVVRETVEAYRPFAARARSALSADIQDGVTGLWDRQALEQIAENLISNAIKYGAGAPVAVRLARRGARAALTVRDSGPGIREDDRERIFAPFEQVAIGSDRRGGFGIGLWVARQLIEAMEGTIAVDATPGGGSTFTVRLACAPRNGKA